MCNLRQPLLSILGLSRIPGMGWDVAHQWSWCWQGGRRELEVTPGGSEPSHPRGCRTAGSPPRAAVTLPVTSAPLSTRDVQLGIVPTWPGGALSTSKRAAPHAVRSSWLLGAPRPLSKGYLSLVNQHTQLMWGWGKVSPGDWVGHDQDARGWMVGCSSFPALFSIQLVI